MSIVDIEKIELAVGGHRNPEAGMCVMEAVAYVAREPHSDHPKCCSPIIASFLRSWNDALNADDRNRLLKPLIPILIGTSINEAVEARRAWMIIDWLIRDFTPPWLRLAKLNPSADALANAPEVNSAERVAGAMQVIIVAKKEAAAAGASARAAARAAAWAATWAAAGASAGASAGDAAWAATWAATWAAAWAAAWDAARDAAWDAAWAAVADAAAAAAGDALRPTTERLQLSAVELIMRMCAVKAA